MESFDAICIGSGHNALIAAAYLARAGWSVLVLERNDRPGGLVRTEELTLPGFKHDVYSSAHPLFVTSAAYAELGQELAERGLHYLNTDTATAVAMHSGETAIFSRDMATTMAEADRLAPGDGAAFAQMMQEFGAYAPQVFSLFSMDLASPAATKIIHDLMHNPDGPGFSPFAAEFLLTARDVLESRFQSPVFRGLIAPWVMHLGRTPEGANSGVWVPLTLMALMGGGMATAAGGSEMLARSLTRLIEDKGGVVRVNCPVERITTKNGKATGVTTQDGEHYAVRRAVIASTNPDQLYLRLLADADIKPALKQQAQNYRYGRGCVQIHLALAEPPRWSDERLDQAGLIHLTGGLDQCSQAINEAMRGLLPTAPTISLDVPTMLDPSRAPQGKATMRLQMLETPSRPRGDAAGEIDVGDGTWTEDLKQRFAERIFEIVGRAAPNVPGAILGYHIISPNDLARFSPNLGPGDPYGGSHDIAQSYLLRPLPSQPSHQSAIPNVYMLGAATWPGHGINGGSGYIVAQELLKSRN